MTIAELIDYLGQFDPKCIMYLDEADIPQDSAEFILLDRFILRLLVEA